MEGEKKDLEDKVESLESIVRMLELKSKNAADHGKLQSFSICLSHCVCLLVSVCPWASVSVSLSVR